MGLSVPGKRKKDQKGASKVHFFLRSSSSADLCRFLSPHVRITEHLSHGHGGCAPCCYSEEKLCFSCLATYYTIIHYTTKCTAASLTHRCTPNFSRESMSVAAETDDDMAASSELHHEHAEDDPGPLIMRSRACRCGLRLSRKISGHHFGGHFVVL